MKASVKMRKSDVSHLLRDLQHMQNAAPDVVNAAVRSIAERTRDLAKESMVAAAGPSAPGTAPHRHTGELAESVRAVVRKRLGKSYGKVGTSLVKGYFLEFGRSNMEPRPWLFPAFEAASMQAEGFLKEHAEELL